jgi:hypothetical protein
LYTFKSFLKLFLARRIINIELLLNRPRFTYFRKQFESKNINYEKNLNHGSYPCGGNRFSKSTN